MFQIFCQLLCMLVLPCTRFSIGSVLSFIVIKFCKSVRHAHWEGLVSSSLLHYLLTQFHVHWYVIFFLLLLSEEGMTFMYINFHDQCSLTLSASHFCLQITVTITTTTIYYYYYYYYYYCYYYCCRRRRCRRCCFFISRSQLFRL